MVGDVFRPGLGEQAFAVQIFCHFRELHAASGPLVVLFQVALYFAVSDIVCHGRSFTGLCAVLCVLPLEPLCCEVIYDTKIYAAGIVACNIHIIRDGTLERN